MAKLLATIKAIITRLLFSCHGLIAIWQVTQYKRDPIYWSLCTPIGLLFFEGFFTLAIKETQEWRWFCPSVFLYLGSVVPAIWLLELDKLERRHKIQEETFNLAEATGDLKNLNKMLGLGVNIKIPNIQMNAEMWVTLIEQFLMLILIVGRWMLPKGDLTRDQLSQLLLVYIGTAADIIEFFDSFKDNTIANEPILVFLTLGIWSWSLLQFTIVLTATRSRKPRGTTAHAHDDEEELNTCCKNCCCSIDVWGIALNILLQDAPFLTFRLLIIIHYRIISYMNVFFTCKNTLVILLQIYRLFVVQAENKKIGNSKKKIDRNHEKQMKHPRSNRRQHSEDIFIISNEKYDRIRTDRDRSKPRRKKAVKKDTGYSTESPEVPRRRRDKDKEEARKAKIYDKKKSRKEEKESSKKARKKEKKKKQDSTEESEDSRDQRRTKHASCIEEESDTSESSSEMPIKKRSNKHKKKSTTESSESSTSSS